MACAFPYLMRADVGKSLSGVTISDKYYAVPCGCCLNCRVDRRNQWSDRCKYALGKIYKFGAFVTLTYDDTTLLRDCVVSPVDGKIRATLNYKELSDYIKRVRSNVNYRASKSKSIDPRINPKFKYLAVGEYGEHGSKIPRPHFHILFFGLDFNACRQIFMQSWQKGILKILPILDGGIDYVLKYLDKQVSGQSRYDKYEAHGCVHPHQVQSRSLGSELYTSNPSDLEKNNWTYPVAHLRRRPVPAYWRNKYKENDTAVPRSREEIVFKMVQNGYRLQDCSVKAQESYKKRQRILKERKLFNQMVNHGQPSIDWENVLFGYPHKSLLATSLVDDEARALEFQQYLQNIFSDSVVYVDNK